MENLANQILEECGVGKMSARLWYKSETAGKSIYTPHQGKKEIARRLKWATQITYDAVPVDSGPPYEKKNGQVTGLKYFNPKIKAVKQEQRLHEACKAKSVKPAVPRTSPRYDKDGVKVSSSVRRMEQQKRLTIQAKDV